MLIVPYIIILLMLILLILFFVVVQIGNQRLPPLFDIV